MKTPNGYIIPDGVAADVVLFVTGANNAGLKILLIKRKNEPFRDCWALPGGFIEPQETIEQAACREIKEEANADIQPADLILVGVYSDPGRDPRGRIISAAYAVGVPREEVSLAVKAGDDAKEVAWLSLPEVLAGKVKLAFDHRRIINEAANRLDIC